MREVLSMHMEYYTSLSDDELVVLYREQQDERASEALMSRYKEMVRTRARSMFILGGEADDLIQEGMIGLFKALCDYDCGRDASFGTFAALCVSRQLYSAIQASGRKKHMPLNTAISLNTPSGARTAGETGSKDETELEEKVSGDGLGGVPAAGFGGDPEKVLIEQENLARLQQQIEAELSPLEKQVLDLYLTGMNYVDIAHILNRDEKSTDNALQRIRAKVRRLIRHD